MSEIKPMTPAEYRAHVQKSRDERPTEIVALKSGAVFELRRPDLIGYVTTGRIPQSLLTEAMKAWKLGVNAATVGAMEDPADMFIFMRVIVQETTVKPKFVEIATNDDEIGAQDMSPADFAEIFAWAMNYKGVAGLDGLRTFREGSERGATGNSTGGKKRRSSSKQVAKT